MQEPGNLVEGILDLTGWTQTRLVHELRKTARLLHEPEPTGLHLVTVNRWKQGRQRPSCYYQRLLRLVYQEVTTRRQFIAYRSPLLAGRPAFDMERLTSALDQGGCADGRLVEELAEALDDRARQWYLDPPDVLLPVVRTDLEIVDELRMRGGGAVTKRRLQRLTAQAAALVGWMSWLCGNREAASAYYMFSNSMACEALDADGRAFVLVARSFLHSSLFHPDLVGANVSIGLLDEAVSLTKRSTSPCLRVFALARRAEELAGGDREPAAAWRDLDLAETILASASGAGQGFLSYWSGDRLRGCCGTCAMLQRRPEETIALLSSTLSTTPPHLAAERSILLADLGAAHAMEEEVERACDLLASSLAVGGATDVNRLGRVATIRRAHLSAWPDAPSVRHLDEELRTHVLRRPDG